MIDNFDQLVARCEAVRRRKMIRLALMIVSTLLFMIAGIAGYQMWKQSQTLPQQETLKAPLSSPKEVNATQLEPATLQESNRSLPPPVAAVSAVNPPATSVTGSKPAATAPTAAMMVKAPISPAPAAPASPKANRLFEVNTPTYSNPVETFAASPSYDAALAAARDFYAKENYVDAAIWAKKANQLNREAEEAWLLYAKSYHAQGRKSEAIGILELYLNYKDSKAASELIRTWKLNSTN